MIFHKTVNHRTLDASGVFEVCLTVTSLNGCEKMLCNTITIQNTPTTDFSFIDSICVEEVVDFSNLPQGNISSCFYNFGDGNFSNECHPSHIYNQSGLFDVMLIVENGNNCLDTLFKPLLIRTVPTADFSYVFVESCEPAIVQFNNLSLNAESYEWDFGDGNTSTAIDPSHTYENAGLYIVTLTAWKDGICLQQINQVLEVFTPILADLSTMSDL